MYSFIVLGLVPGTGIQITFRTWLDLLALAFVAYAILHLRHHHGELINEHFKRRVALHATQLHRRA